MLSNLNNGRARLRLLFKGSSLGVFQAILEEGLLVDRVHDLDNEAGFALQLDCATTARAIVHSTDVESVRVDVGGHVPYHLDDPRGGFDVKDLVPFLPS